MKNKFQERLKLLVKESGLPLDMFAKDIGICKRTLQSYIKGKATPRLNVIISIRNCFNVKVDFLLGLSNEKK